MYIPKHFEEADPAVLHALIRAHPLGTWACLAGGEIAVNHVPFLLEAGEAGGWRLVGHVARANPIWQTCATDRLAVVVFQGPEAYITPSWYAAKREHGKVVPTWNYAVVHAHGRPRFMQDREWLRALVSRLSAEHEAREARPWSVTDAPPEYIEGLLAGVVGVEIPIERLVGKWKMSQNRPPSDHPGIVDGLRARDDDPARAVAACVAERKPPRTVA